MTEDTIKTVKIAKRQSQQQVENPKLRLKAAPLLVKTQPKPIASPQITARSQPSLVIPTPEPEVLPEPDQAPEPVSAILPVADTHLAQSAPKPKSQPIPKEKSNPQPDRQQPDEAQNVAEVSDFPQVAGAAAGCNGDKDCWQVNSTQWRSVKLDQIQLLEQKGFQVTEIEDEDGMSVYNVSQSGKQKYYLHFISTPQQTAILRKPEQLSREELLRAIGQPAVS